MHVSMQLVQQVYVAGVCATVVACRYVLLSCWLCSCCCDKLASAAGGAMLCLQEFLRRLGIVVDTTTVIQQASITRLTDSNSEQQSLLMETAGSTLLPCAVVLQLAQCCSTPPAAAHLQHLEPNPTCNVLCFDKVSRKWHSVVLTTFWHSCIVAVCHCCRPCYPG